MKKTRLARRTLLRGAGVALGLPVLEAMLDGKGLLFGVAHAQSTSAAPIRVLTFFLPNGVPVDRWVPTGTGLNYPMSQCLQSLEPYRAHFNVLSGINLGVGGAGNPHARGSGAFANGMPTTTSGAGGPSVDQVAAQQMKPNTKLTSLAISMENIPNSIGNNEVSTAVYGHASWSARNQPVPPIRDPKQVYQKLVAGGVPNAGGSNPAPTPAGPSPLDLERKSVLDFVSNDIGRLNAQLGAEDKIRLDAHLTGVRELERSIAALTPSSPPPPTAAACTVPNEPPGSLAFTARAKVMLDLIAFAFSCDLTRYGSFMLGIGNTGSSTGTANATLVGARTNQHQCAHDGDTDGITKFTVYQVGLFAHLLGKLHAVSEGNGTLLTNSVIYLGSELSDGRVHSNNNLPVILAGTAGGAIRGGRHIKYSGPPISRMLLAMLQFAKVPVTGFANQTNPLDSLSA